MTAAPAVVVGGGIAGLSAVAALRPFVDDVMLVEADDPGAAPTARPGVPQSDQLHNLLGRAQASLDRLVPGFCDDLVAAGGSRASVADETYVYELGRAMPRRRLGWHLISAARPVIEDVLRQRVLGPGVAVRHARTARLRIAAGRVTGVTIAQDGRDVDIDAALVVDATGARTEAARWLTENGYEAPQVDRCVRTHWYATTVFRRPPEWLGRNDFWLVFATPPRTRGGLVSPDGPEHWRVSVSGVADDAPPRSAADVVAYARTLESPVIADLLDSGTPVRRPTLFRKVEATWRRYDLCRDVVTGFLPIGDAVASLDPLFGQGVSVAAWQATMLGDALARYGATPTAAMTRAYLSGAATACRAAWDLGDAVESPSQDLAADIADHPAIHRAYVARWHLLDPEECAS